MEIIITPGIDRLYAVAVTTPDGGFERVSEHDTPEAACAAKLSAAIAAAKARADLTDIAKASA